MKCPKCGYLGFEHVERCRNCGYDFSLTRAGAPPDLSIRPAIAQSARPLVDLVLGDAEAASETTPVHDFTASARSSPRGLGPTPELPLFGASVPDDRPLITRPSPPRTPLAVRRATPEVPRLRSEPRTATLDLSPPDPDDQPRDPDPGSERAVAPGEAEPFRGVAPWPARIAASAIDVAFLLAVDILVVYFTLQICGLAFREVLGLPRVPLGAFLAFQNLSYLIIFTANGQTPGQMAAGIRVVPTADVEAPPGLRSAAVRTLVWITLAVPAGLGLLTILFTRDRRGLHDRAAGTWVVRSPA